MLSNFAFNCNLRHYLTLLLLDKLNAGAGPGWDVAG